MVMSDLLILDALLILEHDLPVDRDDVQEYCRRTKQEVVEWLNDRNHAAVIRTIDGPVVIFPSAGDTGWYWQMLPLEDPNDADWAGNAEHAIAQLQFHNMLRRD
jgi:hypothetical protein